MRVFLGIWLLFFFAESAGLMDRYKFVAGLFDNVPPLPFSIAIFVGLAASIAFIAGVWVRFSALAMLMALQLFLFAIPRFRIVAFPYISIMLLVTALFYRPMGPFG